MTERTKAYLQARESGLSYREIADMFGVSFQRIAQVCGKHQPSQFRFITKDGCVYPNLRKWMNENKVSKYELARRMGLHNSSPHYSSALKEYMRAERDPNKWFIDKLLEATGMTYEVLFYREDK